MTDAWGYPLAVGDTVVYPGRYGSSLHLNRATIVRIEEWAPEDGSYRRFGPVLYVRRVLEAKYGRNAEAVHPDREYRIVRVDLVTRVG